MGSRPRLEAVVFDLLYTLVHPGTYPGGTGRAGWLAGILGVDAAALAARWAAFEPILESGRADGPDPELAWVTTAAAELGSTVTAADRARIEAGWDLTRREALLHPPEPAIATLVALRARGLKLGILSNTHALELRAWKQSPLAPLVDVVALSHEIGYCKPDRAAYAYVLDRLAVAAGSAAYVGDGGSDELPGARAAGFGLVVLAEQTAAEAAPADLPRLRAQADVSVPSLLDVICLA
ncbi:HAD family hydrolase [Actinoplanes sp. M2I2]|uniref:HAD family hydrolase n=1 Tax=Actinoplanes sp. M2I2 TaxID=1734444 RepID=UPI002020B3AA|nr:HAD family hydrolase [Actinoplanes sp. M2I2]